MKKKINKKITRGISTLTWMLFLVVHLYPIILIFFSSLKSKSELVKNPAGFPRDITFEYFQKAIDKMEFLNSFVNTAIIAIVVVAVLIVLNSMTAYAICRRGKAYNIIYFFFLAGMMIPFQMRMIPLYKFMNDWGLLNKLAGVIFVYLGSLAPMGIFLLTGFVKTVPKELEEAARIDGAGMYRTFFTIVFPLLKGPLSTIAIFNTFTIWNDFLMPMLFLQKRDKLTLTVTLANFQGMYFSDWSMIFAGVCLIVTPMLVIFLIAQKYVISGITAGAVKG